MPPIACAENTAPLARAAAVRPSVNLRVAVARRPKNSGVSIALRVQSGGDSHRISRQCARLIHGTERRYACHHITPAAESAERHAAANDFAQRNQIRSDAEQALRALGADAKAGHHFVQYQQRPVTCAQCAQSVEKSAVRHHQIHVAGQPSEINTVR